jgi:hypothetical protein
MRIDAFLVPGGLRSETVVRQCPFLSLGCWVQNAFREGFTAKRLCDAPPTRLCDQDSSRARLCDIGGVDWMASQRTGCATAYGRSAFHTQQSREDFAVKRLCDCGVAHVGWSTGFCPGWFSQRTGCATSRSISRLCDEAATRLCDAAAKRLCDESALDWGPSREGFTANRLCDTTRFCFRLHWRTSQLTACVTFNK